MTGTATLAVVLILGALAGAASGWAVGTMAGKWYCRRRRASHQ